MFQTYICDYHFKNKDKVLTNVDEVDVFWINNSLYQKVNLEIRVMMRNVQNYPEDYTS